MTLLDELIAANKAATRPAPVDQRPTRRLAVITCMDARIDVFAVLGLELGDAHVIRNAGGRLTDDVLRSLALSSNVLGVDTVVVMQHTRCGLEGASDADLRARTGADLDFLPIADHEASLRTDVERLSSTPYLATLGTMAGFVYDVDSGRVEEVVRWERPG
jgi:carbonic anhydrase